MHHLQLLKMKYQARKLAKSTNLTTRTMAVALLKKIEAELATSTNTNNTTTNFKGGN